MKEQDKILDVENLRLINALIKFRQTPCQIGKSYDPNKYVYPRLIEIEKFRK